MIDDFLNKHVCPTCNKEISCYDCHDQARELLVKFWDYFDAQVDIEEDAWLIIRRFWERI